MEKRSFLFAIIFSLALIMNSNMLISVTTANPLPSPKEYEMGGIVTNNALSFSLTNANVVFNIDSTDFKHNIGISFEGNYTVFNPNNTTEIQIAAPFSFSESVINSNCTVEVNGTQVSFDTGDAYSLGIEDWVMNYTFYYSWTIIICSIIIPENGSQTIKYRFNHSMPNPHDEFSILYDLETSKAWSGNINERVEFRVHGKLPKRYIEMSLGSYEYSVIITDIDYGKIYAWEWNNEQINTLRVGIRYISIFDPMRIIIFVGIAVPISIIVIGFILIRRRRSRRL
ncbi:MAG: hypothetical protein ACFFG0_50200 [Candidatus Thorarchaeota archaeon]